MRKLALVLIPLLLVSCKTIRETVEVPVYVHDTSYLSKVERDSVYVDRWHTVEVSGDTTYIHDSVTMYRERVKTDTVVKVSEVPVVVHQTTTEEVPRALTWWQKTLMWAGGLALAIGALFVLAKCWQKI